MNAFKNMSFAIAWPTILITIGKMRQKIQKTDCLSYSGAIAIISRTPEAKENKVCCRKI